MIKHLSYWLSLAFLGVVLAAAPAAARGGHWHGGGWHGGWHGGGHWHGGWGYRGWGWGGWGYPYYYRPYYWGNPYPYYCGSRWIKVRRGGHWVWRRVLIRCY